MRMTTALVILVLLGGVGLMLLPRPLQSQVTKDEASPPGRSSLELGAPYDTRAQQQFLKQLTADERKALVRLRSRYVLADSDCPLPTSKPTEPFYVKLKGSMTRELADQLADAGGAFLGYYNPHAHLLRARDADSLSAMGEMLRGHPLVVGTLPHEAMDVLPLDLLKQYETGEGLAGDYRVLFWRDVTPAQVGELVEGSGAALLSGSLGGGAPVLKLRLTNEGFLTLIRGHMVEYVTPLSQRATVNADSTQISNADQATVSGSPYNLDGDGQVTAVWDAGTARETHEQYQGLGGVNAPTNWPGSSRVHNVNNVSTHYHAAHVTGTIVADGTNNGQAHGYAPKAVCLVHLWNNVDAERREAWHAFHHVVDNHSYTSANGTSDDWGQYTDEVQTWDATNRDLLLNQAQASGNFAQGLGNLSGIAHDKPFGNSSPTQSVPSFNAHRNGYIIGNCRDNEDINSSSSQGPGHDGRLLPQFTANGTGLTSTLDGSDDDYASFTGTSMAGPSAAGSIALLSQLWRREHNDQYLTPDVGRAILAQTARDKYNTGPDYRFGFGIVDCQAAADLILADKAGGGGRIVRGSIRDGEVVEYEFSVSGSDPIHIVLSWLDVWASVGAAISLVNDLDIELEDPSGGIHYPYAGVTSVSDGDHTHTFTTSGPNQRDNIELVHVDSPAPGTWILRVKGTSIPANPQSGVPNDVTGFVVAGSHSISHQKLVIEDAVNGSTPVAIPDNNPAGIVRTFNVSDPRFVTAVRVHARIQHERRGDLSVRLESPTGTTVNLKTQNNGILDDEADIFAVFPDTKQSDDDVAALICEPVQGAWRVTITDHASGNTGELHYLTLELDVRTNVAPVADAGADFDVREGANGQLDGTGTVDADGDVIEYQWNQIGGAITLNLSNTTAPAPTFTAPAVSSNETVTFELITTDCTGAFTTDTVLVTVLDNAAPVADAGGDFGILTGANGVLDASGSSDPENDPLTYNWTQLSGNITINLSDPTDAAPTFTAPGVTQDEAVTFELTVTDDRGDFSTDTATITVEVNVAPVADAGPDLGLMWNEAGQLDGTASHDPNTGDTITWQWAQVGGGNSVTLSDNTDPQPTFTAPGVDDTLVFELTVTDADGLSAIDQVRVHVNEDGSVPQTKSGGGGKDDGGCSTGHGRTWLFVVLLVLVGGAFLARRREIM